MKKYYILSIVLLQVISAFSQSNYEPGYVITLQGDTLYGEIDYRENRTMRRICRFKTNGNVTEFTPNDITAYRFIDSKYFVSREIDGQKHFFEFLVKGQLNLYALGNLFYIEKENEPLILLPYEKGKTYNKDGKEYFINPGTQLRGRLTYYMQDAPQLQAEINSIGEPTPRNLIKIAKNYHNMVCTTGEECIVFEKKMPPVRVKVELVAQGYRFFNYMISPIEEEQQDDFTILSEYQNIAHFGALLYIGMPRQSENLYFKTGFFAGITKTERLFKVPLQFQYVFFPKWKVRPFLSGGYNFYYIGEPGLPRSLTCSAGLLYAGPKNKLFSSLFYDIDLFGHSLSLGIGYTF